MQTNRHKIKFQCANLGYLLLNQFWEHGYGTEAVRVAIKAGFEHLKLQRLEASIMPSNKASIALAKRVGLKFEGQKRRSDWGAGHRPEEPGTHCKPNLRSKRETRYSFGC